MVYRGKPSGGCGNCRKLHVKCDENRPKCSHCLRMKRICLGYREPLDLLFHHEDISTQGRVQQSSSQKRNSARVFPANPTWSTGKPGIRIASCCRNYVRLLHHPGQSLLPSLEELVICHFYHTTRESLPDSDHARYLHLQLPTLYTQSGSGSPLRLATQAISYASSTKLGPTGLQISRQRYAKALHAIRKAIQDPYEVRSDQTLYAVLLICGYETMTCPAETPQAWGVHVDGAVALLRARDKGRLSTPLSRNLFFFIRRNIVLSHMQTCRPVEAIISELSEMTFAYENVEDRFHSKSMRIPQLQFQASSLLALPRWCGKEIDVVELIQATKKLDSELSDWARDIPPSWRYATATNLRPCPGSEFIPSHKHKYPDFYTARVWNLYRVSRLITQSIILRALSWLSDPSALDKQDDDGIVAETISRELVNDICASVGFLSGDDFSKMRPYDSLQKRASTQTLQLDAKGNTAAQAGRFSLIWPLHIGRTVPSIPESQRTWMRGQLRQMADSGEPYAKLVSLAESQTLSGGVENFRFDCV